MVEVEMVRDRCYVRHEVVHMEEDMTTEFKGHRSILMEDVNPKHWNPNNMRSNGRTRQPWSKYMAGFLNSGLSGVYSPLVRAGFFVVKIGKEFSPQVVWIYTSALALAVRYMVESLTTVQWLGLLSLPIRCELDRSSCLTVVLSPGRAREKCSGAGAGQLHTWTAGVNIFQITRRNWKLVRERNFMSWK